MGPEDNRVRPPAIRVFPTEQSGSAGAEFHGIYSFGMTAVAEQVFLTSSTR